LFYKSQGDANYPAISTNRYGYREKNHKIVYSKSG